jgi:Tfp pilus assembly major pilin PilA
METKFEEFKAEILRRAKAAGACTDEYRRARKAKDFGELMQVIKDNFGFAVRNNVINADLVERYSEPFSENGVHLNVDCESGFLFVTGTNTVRASGYAVAYATDQATVHATGCAVVHANDHVTVRATDCATVHARGHATVHATCHTKVHAMHNAIVHASGLATVYACDLATVHAKDNAFIISFHVAEYSLSGKAIHRIYETDTVRYASDKIKFEKTEK